MTDKDKDKDLYKFILSKYVEILIAQKSGYYKTLHICNYDDDKDIINLCYDSKNVGHIDVCDNILYYTHNGMFHSLEIKSNTVKKLIDKIVE